MNRRELFKLLGIGSLTLPLKQASGNIINIPYQKPASEGNFYFVSAIRGSNNWCGSQQRPWRTLKHALGQCSSKDSISVEDPVFVQQVGPVSEMTQYLPNDWETSYKEPTQGPLVIFKKPPL